MTILDPMARLAVVGGGVVLYDQPWPPLAGAEVESWARPAGARRARLCTEPSRVILSSEINARN